MIGVAFPASALSARLGGSADIASDHALLRILGRRGANDLKKHFRSRNSTPNKLGGRRSNFWLQVASSVQSPVIAGTSSVRIDITHPAYAQKLYGGTITAKRAKFLTIPVHPQAYGRTAAVFERETGIELFRPQTSEGVLVRLLMGIGPDGGLTVYYVLKRSVTQKADPNAFPNRETFADGLTEEARKYTLRKLKAK